MVTNYFKIHQRNGVYHFFKVVGGPGKTRTGYQGVINFLNHIPQIYIERNYIDDPSGQEGTWDTFDKGEAISEEEYKEMYRKATTGAFSVY